MNELSITLYEKSSNTITYWRTARLANNWESTSEVSHRCNDDTDAISFFVFFFSSTLRSLPQSLSIKRQIKSKVELTVKNKSRQIGMNRWKRAIYNIGIFNSKTKQIIRKTIVNSELWYEAMKEIEGHFGGGVGTYFQFLRFLFVLNFLSMITVLRYASLPLSACRCDLMVIFCLQFHCASTNLEKLHEKWQRPANIHRNIWGAGEYHRLHHGRGESQSRMRISIFPTRVKLSLLFGIFNSQKKIR